MSSYYYKDLLVWQKAMDLVEIVYKIVRWLPKEEQYGLSDQMRRAAVSIPSNIAEGQQRYSDKDFKYFLSIARGSGAELETQILVCERLGYLSKDLISEPLRLCGEINRMLSGLMIKLSQA